MRIAERMDLNMPFALREVLEMNNVPEYIIDEISDDYRWFKRHLDLADREIEYLYGVLDSLETALADATR